MENRKITVVSARTHEKLVLETSAETLGELKELLREKGMDLNNINFYEAISKTQLIEDNSQLPTNVKKMDGTLTNDLLFLLHSNEKIKSGNIMSRRQLINEIEAMDGGNLGNCCYNFDLAFEENEEHYLTDEQLLQYFIALKERKNTVKQNPAYYTSDSQRIDNLEKAVKAIAESLKGIVKSEDVKAVLNSIEVECPYTDEEIEKIINR